MDGMKRGLVILGLVLAGVIGLAFVYDAISAKPQRAVLIEKDYKPASSAPAPAGAADELLTPMPE